MAAIPGLHPPVTQKSHLVETSRRRHGSLNSQATNVLPALLQQRDKVVDGQHNVADQFLLGHTDIANGDTHAQNLLQLELDGRLDLVDLASEVVGVGDGCGELASYRNTSISLRVGGGEAFAAAYPWTDRGPGDEESA